MINKGIFCISLDFELHWGGVEKRKLPGYETYFSNTRKVIPRMLELFRENGIHVTWATVGMLFHRSLFELWSHAPAKRPSYEDPFISTYTFIDMGMVNMDENDSPYHFAPSLISNIKNTPGQEIGSHTYSHYYCNEPGQGPEDFRNDIRAAISVARQNNIDLRTLVFPRNQFNEDYLDVCYEEGLRAVRSNPKQWFWDITNPADESMWKRLNRGMDAYFPLSRTSFPIQSLKRERGKPLCIPASRFLRPHSSFNPLLNRMRLIRICKEMTVAAKRKEVYHLWWHPHNFGAHPEASMHGLRTIISHYSKLHRKYGMVSMNMGEINDVLENIP